MGFGDVNRDVQTLELLALGRADAAGPEQQQVRLQAEQSFQIQLPITPHRGQATQRVRPFTAVEYAHQQIAGAQFNDDFR